MIDTVLSVSLLGKARAKSLVSYHPLQIRDFARDKHRTVDDTPYGGGEGMVMKVNVLYDAWSHAVDLCARLNPQALETERCTILLTPQGARFDQKMAKELSSTYSQLILVCGHYEGVDERFTQLCVDREVSIGDFVLTGGEIPALVLADAMTRLLPGVVGNERSLAEESLERNLLKYPQYTRPRVFEGLEVPEILLSGDHEAIAEWRRNEMEIRTRARRPDLFGLDF